MGREKNRQRREKGQKDQHRKSYYTVKQHFPHIPHATFFFSRVEKHIAQLTHTQTVSTARRTTIV